MAESVDQNEPVNENTEKKPAESTITKFFRKRFYYNALDESEKTHKQCTEWTKEALKDPYPKFLLWHLKERGCPMPIERFICEPCDAYGLYDADRKEVVLCENNLKAKQRIIDTLCHELIHTFDDCKVVLDPNNLKHLACSEIRAANLSTDCWFFKENFMRLNFGWKAHRPVCVRRHAIKNLVILKNISEEKAKAAVDSVFDACFSDSQPFDRIPP